MTTDKAKSHTHAGPPLELSHICWEKSPCWSLCAGPSKAQCTCGFEGLCSVAYVYTAEKKTHRYSFLFKDLGITSLERKVECFFLGAIYIYSHLYDTKVTRESTKMA